MRLRRIWAFKIKAFASHGHFLNTLGVPCCLTLRYKNPRAASLRLAERHNLPPWSYPDAAVAGAAADAASAASAVCILSCTYRGARSAPPVFT